VIAARALVQLKEALLAPEAVGWQRDPCKPHPLAGRAVRGGSGERVLTTSLPCEHRPQADTHPAVPPSCFTGLVWHLAPPI